MTAPNLTANRVPSSRFAYVLKCVCTKNQGGEGFPFHCMMLKLDLFIQVLNKNIQKNSFSSSEKIKIAAAVALSGRHKETAQVIHMHPVAIALYQ